MPILVDSNPFENLDREKEADDRVPEFDVWERFCELYGWPRTFGGSARG
jgi:hypothetical protein